MKTVLLWAGIFITLYAGLAAGSHFTRVSDVKKIVVAIDVSGSMSSHKNKLDSVLSFLKESQYNQYKIITNSPNLRLQEIQDWGSFLNLEKVRQINMYAPLSLEPLVQSEVLKEADEIIFVTNAQDVSELKNIPKSRIIRP